MLSLALLLLAVSTPADLPSAWFLENPAKGEWCAFKSPEALEAFAKTLDLSKVAGGPGYGWLQLKNGRLSTIMVETVSDAATLDDQYLISPKGEIYEMLRSAHRVGGEEWVSFAYAQDHKGSLGLLTAKTIKSEDRPLADWPRHAKLSAIPFAGLIETKSGKTLVREGCVRTPA